MYRIARQSSKLPDEVRFLGRALDNNMSSGCAGFARDPAKVEDQVRFLARTFAEKAYVVRVFERKRPLKNLLKNTPAFTLVCHYLCKTAFLHKGLIGSISQLFVE